MSEEEKQEFNDPADDYKGRMDEIIESSQERDKEANLYQRIHAVMKEVWYVKKEGNTGQYSTVEHDDVTRKVRPAIVRHGIAVHLDEVEEREPTIVPISKYNSKTNESYEETHFLSQAKIWVKFVNIDDPEDSIRVPMYGMEKDKMPMTVSGKILSYSFKYAILKTFFLETGDREDTDTLVEQETDLNAVYVYNELGEELFGEEWEKVSRKKIYRVTKGQTAEASRAPTPMLYKAIRGLHELKKKREENPEKDMDEINEEHEKENNGNDITSDFQ